MFGDLLGLILLLFPGFLAGAYYYKLIGRDPCEKKLGYTLWSLAFSLVILLLRLLVACSHGLAHEAASGVFYSCRNYILYAGMAAGLAVVLPNVAFLFHWLWSLIAGLKKK